MPDPQRLLKTLQRACQAFAQAPGRQGHWVDIDGASDVLVVGDLHGHLDNFRRILTIADLGTNTKRHLVLQELVHGPFRYPGGGDKSHQLLDLIAALKCQYPHRVHLLLGNHELAQWTGQWIAKDEVDLNELFRAGVEHAYAGRAAEVYAAYVKMFDIVPVAIRTSNRVLLTHSLPTASRLTDFEPARLRREAWEDVDLKRGGCLYALVWGRDTTQANTEAFLKKMDADLLVAGHIPCDDGFAVPNTRQLILDAKGTPAAYCLFPSDKPVTQQDLLNGVNLLS